MPQVDEILINANRETGRYAAFGYPVISDQISGFAGPLAGLHAGMLNAKNDFVLTVPCDSPLLPENLAERLMEALIHAQADIAIAQTGAQLHPVFCLCNKSLLPELTEYLLSGERKVETWVNRKNWQKLILRIIRKHLPMSIRLKSWQRWRNCNEYRDCLPDSDSGFLCFR